MIGVYTASHIKLCIAPPMLFFVFYESSQTNKPHLLKLNVGNCRYRYLSLKEIIDQWKLIHLIENSIICYCRVKGHSCAAIAPFTCHSTSRRTPAGVSLEVYLWLTGNLISENRTINECDRRIFTNKLNHICHNSSTAYYTPVTCYNNNNTTFMRTSFLVHSSRSRYWC